MSHTFPVANVMREDEVTCADRQDEMLQNAPERTEDAFVVPATFD